MDAIDSTRKSRPAPRAPLGCWCVSELGDDDNHALLQRLLDFNISRSNEIENPDAVDGDGSRSIDRRSCLVCRKRPIAMSRAVK